MELPEESEIKKHICQKCGTIFETSQVVYNITGGLCRKCESGVNPEATINELRGEIHNENL
jgi:ribosomal protein L40E